MANAALEVINYSFLVERTPGQITGTTNCAARVKLSAPIRKSFPLLQYVSQGFFSFFFSAFPLLLSNSFNILKKHPAYLRDS